MGLSAVGPEDILNVLCGSIYRSQKLWWLSAHTHSTELFQHRQIWPKLCRLDRMGHMTIDVQGSARYAQRSDWLCYVTSEIRNQSRARDFAATWRLTLMWIAGQQIYFAHVQIDRLRTFYKYLMVNKWKC